MQRRAWFDRKFELGLPLEAFPDALERLRRTPLRLVERTDGLPPAALKQRADRAWSIQENVGHLADLERLWLGRLDDFDDGLGTLRPADLQNRATWDADHNSREIREVLAEFRALRGEFVARVSVMTPAELARTAAHPRLGQPMSVIDLSFFMAEHDDHHLATITALRERATPITYAVRLAEPADIPILASVESRAVQLFYGWMKESGLTPPVLEEVSTVEDFEDARRRGHLWVAALPDGSPIAFALVIELDGMAHLDELDVLPEHARKGVGSKLLEAVCRGARRAGYSKLTLSTFRDVPWNRPFYERRGFRVVDARDLPEGHRDLIEAERGRGLRTDLRVIMEYPLGD